MSRFNGWTERLCGQLEGAVVVSAAGEYRAREAGVCTAAGEVLLGVDGDRNLHLLMPVPAGTVVAEDRRSEGVKVTKHELMERGLRRLYVDLVCSKPHLERTFYLLADEILENLEGGQASPDRIAAAAIGRWRELLDSAPRPRLGSERLAGLFAELYFLRELTALTWESLAIWTGPRMQRHDFTRGVCSVEVKATLSSQRRIHVNGLDQLLPPQGGRLHLLFFRLEESSGCECVPDLIDAIVDAGIDRRGLLTLLAGIGYDVAYETEYRRRCFRVVSRHVYQVTEDFPRITVRSFAAGALPAGVESVSYIVNLDAAAHLEIPAVKWERVLQELVGSQE